MTVLRRFTATFILLTACAAPHAAPITTRTRLPPPTSHTQPPVDAVAARELAAVAVFEDDAADCSALWEAYKIFFANRPTHGLARMRARLLVDLSNDAAKQISDCSAFRTETRAMADVMAIERYGPDGQKAAEQELLRAAECDDRIVSAAAKQILVRNRSSQVSALLVSDLDSSDREARTHAVQSLQELGPLPPGVVPLLREMAGMAREWDLVAILDALASTKDASNVDVFVSSLAIQDEYVQNAAIEGLAALGALARAAAKRLEHVALTHWSWRTRAKAAAASSAVSGTSVLPRGADCSLAMSKTGNRWSVTVRGATTSLREVDVVEKECTSPTLEAESGRLAMQPRSTAVLGAYCVAAFGAESGKNGVLMATQNGHQPLDLGIGNYRAVTRAGNSVFAISSRHRFTHLGRDRDLIARFVPSRIGPVPAHDLHLPGVVLRYGVDAGGDLLLIVHEGDLGEPPHCPVGNVAGVEGSVLGLRVTKTDELNELR
ncbi:MAG: hypothetical protein JWM74_2107 [Myxococcaceae bacterium]|nr:hypothetical protein [Myxococcaceae bacterium]